MIVGSVCGLFRDVEVNVVVGVEAATEGGVEAKEAAPAATAVVVPASVLGALGCEIGVVGGPSSGSFSVCTHGTSGIRACSRRPRAVGVSLPVLKAKAATLVMPNAAPRATEEQDRAKTGTRRRQAMLWKCISSEAGCTLLHSTNISQGLVFSSLVHAFIPTTTVLASFHTLRSLETAFSRAPWPSGSAIAHSRECC